MKGFTKKRLLALGMAASMLLTACSTNSGHNNSSGTVQQQKQYREEDITPSGASAAKVFVTEEGELLLFNSEYSTLYRSADGGESWQQENTSGNGNINDASMSPNGDILLVSHKGLILLQDGKSKKLDLPFMNQYANQGLDPFISFAKLVADNRFLVGISLQINGEYQSILILSDLEGEQIVDLSEYHFRTAAGDGEIFYGLEYGGFFRAFNAQDGTPVENSIGYATILDEFTLPASTILDGKLYTADAGRVQYAQKGENANTLFSGLNFSFGGVGSSPTGIAATQDAIYVTSSGKLYRYTENADSDMTVLRIWALEDNNLVRAAAALFRAEHPEVYIELDIPLSDTGSIQGGDAVVALNTQIMAGKGPDVLILDGAPVDSYLDAGILADISGMVDTHKLYPNLLKPFEDSEAVYMVPATYNVTMLIADEPVEYATLTDYAAAIASGLHRSAAEIDVIAYEETERLEREAYTTGWFMYYDEMFEKLWPGAGPAILQNNTLNVDALTEFFEALKTIAQSYGLEQKDRDDNRGASWGGNFNTSAEGFLYMTGFDSGSSLAYVGERSLTAVAEFTFLTDFARLYSKLSAFDRPVTEFNALPGLVDGAWTPKTLTGIRADSDQQDLAAAFINTMLSEEIQSSVAAELLPVTVEGAALMVRELYNIINDPDRPANMELAEESEPFDYDAIVALLQTPNLIDGIVRDAVADAGWEYCKGSVSLDGAVEQAGQILRIYLNERQQ